MTSILFVCTGNTCRSPLAEGLMKKLLAEKGVEGVEVSSAGTAAFDGDSVSYYAAKVLLSRGIDISMHRSRVMTREMISQSDYIITMTEAQKSAVAAYCNKNNLYCIKDFAGYDISDPFGSDEESYERCAEQIEKALEIFYDEIFSKRREKMKIPVASDHAAYAAKKELIAYLQEKGCEVVDMGCFSEESVNYPEFGARLAKAVSEGEYEKGILLCGTGIGMSIVANKYPRVRAALCHDEFTATASREHNDANVLVMGARVLDTDTILHLTDIWLNTAFTGGRHAARLALIADIEKENFK